MEQPKEPVVPQPNQVSADAEHIVDAEDLFHGRREVWIEHEGVRYRLRITRRNKLILQK